MLEVGEKISVARGWIELPRAAASSLDKIFLNINDNRHDWVFICFEFVGFLILGLF